MHTSRRTLLTALATLLTGSGGAWLGYRHLHPRPPVHIDRPGLPIGHRLRDQTTLPAADARYTCDTLILGSGAAGLSAAWQLDRQGHRDFLIAEGPESNGNSAGYYHDGLAAPSGAHYLALPSQESTDVRDLLTDLGILTADGYREEDLIHAPAERLLYRGQWQDSLLPQEDSDSRRFHALIQTLKHARGADGRKIFAIPVIHSSADRQWRQLDRLTFAQWLARENYRSANLLWYLDYCCRDDYGQGIAHISAFAGLHYFAARGHDNDAVLTWPDGLAHLCRRIRTHIGLETLEQPPETPRTTPAAIPATALHIAEHPDHVRVLLHQHHTRQTLDIRARHVISAMPLHIARRITAQPERYGLDAALPQQSAWLIGNFLLDHLPPEKDHYPLCWDNVIHTSPALGYIHAEHQRIRTAKPARTLLTTYHALQHDSPAALRRWLLDASEAQLLEHAAQDLISAYGQNIYRHIRAIRLTLRAHAMSIPHPGYLEQLAALRAHHSRLTFAHSDLSGYSVFEEAVYWGAHAARQRLHHPL